MNKFILKSIGLVGLASVVFSSCENSGNGGSETSEEAQGIMMVQTSVPDPNIQEDVLPYTIEFVEQEFSNKPALPGLQSFTSAVNQAGEILVVGGRRQGLHTFKAAPEKNFIPDSANNFLYVVNPETGDFWSFDVNGLKDELSAPLQSNNLQGFHDEETDEMYVIGGYGWKADGTDMKTFPSIIRFKVEAVSQAIKNGASTSEMEALMEYGEDDRFAVTGGDLIKLNGRFYLVFGQRFDGQYRAFGGTDFTQEYTEEVRIFTLKPGSLDILTYGTSTSPDPDQPFHRRDGNIIEDLDPSTGQERITALGGVFPPGIIGGYDYPIYINGPQNPVVKKDVHQKFSQYECPIISIYDDEAENKSIYRTMFGGIGLYYYSQDSIQKTIYDKATAQGRNDGMPFVADISTFIESADGTYSEYINSEPIKNNRLLGSSVTFIGNRNLESEGKATSNGILKLSGLSNGEKVLAGYILGGIEAAAPLPDRPNEGTWASNSIFAVYVTKTPSGAIPASFATKADPNTQ
ncbi:hypothetical protein [Algoriphagus halophilus]|uniref:Uncharacterized protein n=1 Tax=Algoriphagus halophilus TaxID=226505 RepID=A0A1N6G695_9BACT|nr:hypothetical protein [Algoriphagus halophilus]SIO03027.1 hypothetical protein SAMN05444394_3002 [Algoriphagus halophilus]